MGGTVEDVGWDREGRRNGTTAPAPPIQCFIHWLCARYKLFLWLWLWLRKRERRKGRNC